MLIATCGGLVAKSCPTLCNSMHCSTPGSSVHGILQARILEWVAISFSRGSSQPRNWTQVLAGLYKGPLVVLWLAGRKPQVMLTQSAGSISVLTAPGYHPSCLLTATVSSMGLVLSSILAGWLVDRLDSYKLHVWLGMLPIKSNTNLTSPKVSPEDSVSVSCGYYNKLP